MSLILTRLCRSPVSDVGVVNQLKLDEGLFMRLPVPYVFNFHHSLIEAFDRNPQPLIHERISVPSKAVNLSLFYSSLMDSVL